jgi:4'-phosphopantetheinyl transferase
MRRRKPRMIDPNEALPENHIHIWQISLTQPEPKIQSFSRLLSQAETDRASRFRFGRHRRRFVVSHGVLRLILARYLKILPPDIQFECGSHGKPFLAGKPANSALQFNLAHSHELAIVAITRGSEIGVDVEHLRPNPDKEAIAQRFFSPAEYVQFSEIPLTQKTNNPTDLQTLAFFNCWTRKEAFIKALGDGLSHPLNQFDVTLTPGKRAQLLRVGDDPLEAEYWSLESFAPQPDYVGALAVRLRNIQVQFNEFNFENFAQV